MRDWKLGVAAFALALLGGNAAWAQGPVEPGAGPQDGDDYFRRDRNVSVDNRHDAALEELGWRAGGFWIQPELTLSAGYSDNVTASDANPQTSAVLSAELDVDIVSNWSRHALSAGLRTTTVDYDVWTTTDILTQIDGRYDVTRRLRFEAGAEYGSHHEPLSFRAAGQEVSEPLEYETLGAYLAAVIEWNRLRLSGRGRIGAFDYHDGELAGGLPLEVDDRDLTETAFIVRGEYALTELTSVFVSAAVNERDHDLAPPLVASEEDSSGYDLLAGANFDWTGLARGELGFGYFSQSFERPGAETAEGFAAMGRLELYPDDLVTVTLGLERRVKEAPVEEVSAPSAISVTGTNGSLALAYEFRRNLLLSARSDYNLEDYNQIDRQDERLNLSLGAEYDLNRRTAFFVALEHETQDSSGADAGRIYDVNIATVGVRLRR